MRPAVKSTARQNQKGSTLVESTLVLILFLTVMIGIADMGQALFLRASLTERMRDALRSGVLAYDATAVKNHVLYGTRTPAADARPMFNLTEQMVDVTRLDANTSADRVRITISNYPLVFYTPFLARRVSGPAIVAIQQVEMPPSP